MSTFRGGKKQRLSASFKQQPSLLSLAKERKAVSELSKWSRLPLELLVHILNYLELKDRKNFFLVCTTWSRTANVPSLWVESWVIIKSLLTAPSTDFWHLVQRRSINKVILRGNSPSNNIDSLDGDLLMLYSNSPNLTGLRIDYPNSRFISSSPFKRVLKFKNLKELSLDFKKCHFTSMDMLCDLVLGELVNLKRLSLFNFVVSDQSSCEFLYHPTLSSLHIETSSAIFKPVGTTILLSCFPQLRYLTIKNCHYFCSFLSLRILRANEKTMPILLSHVSLARTIFDGTSCHFPDWFCRINFLDLSFCKQTHKQLEHFLSQFGYLQNLNLTGNFCADETLKSIVSTTIESLNLSFNQDITVNGLYNLNLMIGSSLRHLSLSHCSGLISKREEILNIVMNLFPNIKSLDLSGWNLSSSKINRILFNSKNGLSIISDTNGSLN